MGKHGTRGMYSIICTGNQDEENVFIGAFGPTTAETVEKLGYRLDIKAPTPDNPSMPAALEKFIKANNGK